MKNKMLKPQIILICKSIWFHSPKDEDAFFEWINKIPSIIKYDGKFDELYLYFNKKTIDDTDLRELLSLFYRYKVKMEQLAIFLNKKNKIWFHDDIDKFWHKKVFKSKLNK